MAGNVDSVDKTMVSLTDADADADTAAADDFGASAEYVEKVLAALLLMAKEVVAAEDSVCVSAGWLSANVDSVDSTMVSLVDAAADDFGV